ncbi:peptidyl-dipeptidase dcp, partial [Escherichia coli 0.1288]|jgi:hypothetical protein
LRY